ncbi:MAG: hypothetical protein DRJ10_01185 [Bacteroidetes bacterium]|nr:MAG: hypothetical protein DRJ10_01185 [Bacteroidota bacterium]
MRVYSKEEIIEMEDLYALQELDVVYYQLSKGELGWLEFIKGKYSIADYVYSNLYNGILALERLEMSKVLDDDCKGFGKAAMLSDDSGLQRLFFWLYIEEE